MVGRNNNKNNHNRKKTKRRRGLDGNKTSRLGKENECKKEPKIGQIGGESDYLQAQYAIPRNKKRPGSKRFENSRGKSLGLKTARTSEM